MPKLEVLEVVEEELEVIEDLESVEIEDSSLPVENEDSGGCTSFYDNDDDMAQAYGATQGLHQSFEVVGTIKLEVSKYQLGINWVLWIKITIVNN